MTFEKEEKNDIGTVFCGLGAAWKVDYIQEIDSKTHDRENLFTYPTLVKAILEEPDREHMFLCKDQRLQTMSTMVR